jgi:hypothetical protein
MEIAATKLAPLLGEVVFVGGATELLITDLGSVEIRPTLNVDIIAEIGSYAKCGVFPGRLRILGFSVDTSENAPLCRWARSRRDAFR